MFNHRFEHNIFWAGFIGFLLGILFSFTVWAGNRVIQTKASLGDDSSIASQIFSTFNLSVATPPDGATVDSANLVITGTTTAKATVLISGGAADQTVDSDGTFSVSYPLLEGENEISVSAISDDGRLATVIRNIFYTQEPL